MSDKKEVLLDSTEYGARKAKEHHLLWQEAMDRGDTEEAAKQMKEYSNYDQMAHPVVR